MHKPSISSAPVSSSVPPISVESEPVLPTTVAQDQPSPTQESSELAHLTPRPSRSSSQASSVQAQSTLTDGASPSLLSRVRSSAANGMQKLTSSLSSGAVNLYSLVDLRTMLQIHAHDPEFLAILQGEDLEQPMQHTLASCRQQIDELEDLITPARAPGLTEHHRKQLLSDIKAVKDALQPLGHSAPKAIRALKSIGNLVNLWPVLVPSPLLAKQAKTFAFTMSTATKGVLAVSMSALRPTADGYPFVFSNGQLGRDANEWHLYNGLINTLFLGNELAKNKFGNESSKKQAAAVGDSIGYGASVSVTFTAIMLTPFLWSSLSKLGNKVLDQTAGLRAGLAQSVGLNNAAQSVRNRLTPSRISEELRAQLQDIRAHLDASSDAFKQARQDFVGDPSGKELTRTVNGQCTHLLETLDRCSKRLASTLQLEGNQTSSLPRELHNHDFSSKLALMILATTVTGSTVYFVQPDRLGTLNLLSDTMIVTAVMAQSAWNRLATRQDAMDRFKAMCGGSMVIALALGADKLSKVLNDESLIEGSPNAQFYAGAIMSLMAVTMPGPIARGAELTMNWVGSSLLRRFTGPDGTELATRTPTSFQDMQEHMQATAQYVEGLDPEQREHYARGVGENVAQAIQAAASQTPPQAPQSSVTITEIEETGSAAMPEHSSATDADRPRPK
ncbi:XopX family type III secretion system effector [Xanthomonas prunicola]